jgi:hypothetical protein
MTDDKYSFKNITGSISMRVNVFKCDTELDKYQRLLKAVQDEIAELEADDSATLAA